MNIFLTFAIICSLGVSAVLGRSNREGALAKKDRIYHECARELNINEEIFEDNQRDLLEKNICLQACITRKFVDKELAGKDNKETLYNFFSRMIEDEHYEEGFESEKFTRQDIVHKIEKCYITERTECEFFRCVDPFHAPFYLPLGLINKEEQTTLECARELNISVEIFNDNQRLGVEETMCPEACFLRKVVVQDLVGKDNKETVYNLFSKIVVEAYKAGFESEKFTRQDAVHKIEKCYITERTECEFYKCVDRYHAPISDVDKYFFNHDLVYTIINSKYSNQ